ncbi:hypothetical protein N9408_01815 [Opitutales bacterium]|nr:hypothetical protein [Opitutales bacterium]
MKFKSSLALFYLFLSACLYGDQLAGSQPNILFILTDDQGKGGSLLHGQSHFTHSKLG